MKTESSRRPIRLIFLTACFLCCLVPLVGMLWARTDTTTENRELADVPVLLEDGTWNTDYLADWGTYFEDHFAYRNELVTVNAKLRAGLLQVSAADSVVVGTDGWLYYYGTLGDYCGWSVISDREADNIAFNLSLMQGYAQAYGADFVLTFAPDKNALYDEHMPYYYQKSTEHSLEKLEERLEAYQINYCDLYEAFSAEDEVLYYVRDTHWNTKGALFACRQLLDMLGNTEALDTLSSLTAVQVDDYVGDLNEMLYPTDPDPETDYSYDEELTWEFTEGESTEDSIVVTNGTGSGILLMFRDSFANNMIPFLATAYHTAYFTKMVPYDLTEIGTSGADTVIIERAERNLGDLGENPAIMPAPGVSVDVQTDGATEGGIAVTEDGSYLAVTGDLPEAYRSEDVTMYLGVEKSGGDIAWYVPFHVSTDESDYGYKAYLSESAAEDAVKIYLACTSGEKIVSMAYVSLSD